MSLLEDICIGSGKMPANNYYPLIFFPLEIKEEILEWVSTLDAVVSEKRIENDTMHIRYDCITFMHEEDEVAFRLKYWMWIDDKCQ